ncbi:threonine aspartase 1 isoform X2 [Macrosteles quadrilineatus]|uniref:threonine aspartase 1 isoform X2 n=1 Tax=Macrosteles quadrilineatus TaxID=74068 RepID=UPI0023E14D88|nr:threonine aspartase 1 isoform X2 [Macrosteles quadrilineatus]
MSGFVCVHVGAGQHSNNLGLRYEQLCREASKQGIDVLKRGGSAIDAVVEATMLLEDSPLTNSGFGSNLSWNGQVECDASVMNGENFSFGACGAVAGVKNPVALAKHICQQQLVSLPLGRVPPSLLAGEGAFKYAIENNITIVDCDSLISARALKMYKHCKKRLSWYDEHSAKLMKTEEQIKQEMQEVLDTVGAVCVDSAGNIAAACSSGGVLLKREGRIGQAGIQGAGCWAQGDVGVVTTGCGEHLISTCLAREVARNIKSSKCPITALQNTVREDFLNSPLLSRVEEKLAGVLVVKTYEAGRGEMIYAHTTQSMCIGYSTTNQKKPKSRMSRLPPGSKHGQSIAIEGVCF